MYNSIVKKHTNQNASIFLEEQSYVFLIIILTKISGENPKVIPILIYPDQEYIFFNF